MPDSQRYPLKIYLGKKVFNLKIDYFKWRLSIEGACGFMERKIKDEFVRIDAQI